MENTLENKAKLFALYWGQNVRFWTLNGPSVLSKVGHTYMTKAILDSCTLELKPISSISDEDAIEVAKIACPMLFYTYSKGHVVDRTEKDWLTVKHDRNIKSVDIDFDGYVCVCNEDLNYERNPYVFQAIRKLQELGYYIGDGTEIDYGWVKLRESEVQDD